MRWLILDEADLLMSGGFQRDVSNILSDMQSTDTDSRAQLLCRELDLSLQDFYNRPRKFRKRSLQGGYIVSYSQVC